VTFFSSAATWLHDIKQHTHRQHPLASPVVATTPRQAGNGQYEYLSIAMAGVKEQFDAIMVRLDRIEQQVEKIYSARR